MILLAIEIHVDDADAAIAAARELRRADGAAMRPDDGIEHALHLLHAPDADPPGTRWKSGKVRCKSLGVFEVALTFQVVDEQALRAAVEDHGSRIEACPPEAGSGLPGILAMLPGPQAAPGTRVGKVAWGVLDIGEKPETAEDRLLHVTLGDGSRHAVREVPEGRYGAAEVARLVRPFLQEVYERGLRDGGDRVSARVEEAIRDD